MVLSIRVREQSRKRPYRHTVQILVEDDLALASALESSWMESRDRRHCSAGMQQRKAVVSFADLASQLAEGF
jgi:hypothetical protein